MMPPTATNDRRLFVAGAIAVVAVVGLVTGVAALGRSGATATRQVTSVAAARSELAPDPKIVHYRHALTAVASGPAEDAEVIAALEARRAAGTAAPQDLAELANAYLTRAQRAGDVADFAAAEATARASLAALPSPNGAALTLAKLETARHDFRGAIAEVNRYLATGGSPAAHIILATAHLALGELPRASEAAEAAVSANPSSGAYLMRALVMQAQGRDAEAAFDFSRAAVVEDAEPEAAARLRALWGRFLIRRGELASAAVVLDEAVRIVPAYPLAVAQQGELALRAGRIKEAKTLFDRAFVASREVRYLIDLSRAQELAGDPTSAGSTRAQVEKLVRRELAAHGLGHRLDLVEILTDRGTADDLTEAIALGREEVGARPSADTRFQLARALARAGAYVGALIEIRAALATGARDARMFELAARLERHGGNPARGDLYAAQAAALDPESAGWRAMGLIP